jgi:hypothetical protein
MRPDQLLTTRWAEIYIATSEEIAAAMLAMRLSHAGANAGPNEIPYCLVEWLSRELMPLEVVAIPPRDLR